MFHKKLSACLNFTNTEQEFWKIIFDENVFVFLTSSLQPALGWRIWLQKGGIGVVLRLVYMVVEKLEGQKSTSSVFLGSS